MKGNYNLNSNLNFSQTHNNNNNNGQNNNQNSQNPNNYATLQNYYKNIQEGYKNQDFPDTNRTRSQQKAATANKNLRQNMSQQIQQNNIINYNPHIPIDMNAINMRQYNLRGINQ